MVWCCKNNQLFRNDKEKHSLFLSCQNLGRPKLKNGRAAALPVGFICEYFWVQALSPFSGAKIQHFFQSTIDISLLFWGKSLKSDKDPVHHTFWIILDRYYFTKKNHFEVVRLTKRPVAKGLQPLRGCQRLTKVDMMIKSVIKDTDNDFAASKLQWQKVSIDCHKASDF